MKSGKKSREQILIVDDSASTLEVLQRNLSSQGYTIFTAPGVAEATKILDSAEIDLVITDWKMPRVDGLDLVRHVRENFVNTEVIIITGYATVQGAVDAVKIGAEDYLPKPFTDEELYSAVEKALSKLSKRKTRKSKLDKKQSMTYGILGESKEMSNIFDSIPKAAATSATVLITGESGTGKELVARAIHYNSARSSAPFVPINCGGIPEALLESELFGYLKGAFTGANTSRAGFFQTADGGTIFLDEISETSPAMQIKLLRVLQDKQVCMVGANRTIKVDVRIIAATNKDLLNLTDAGRFREDLFFRLNVIPITIPPLRERENDIPLLIQHFTTKFAREYNKAIPSFSEKAIEVLCNYNWPGNVRELENVIQHLIIMTDTDIIEISDLPSLMRFSALRKTNFKRTLEEVQVDYIKNVLASVNSNKSKAAKILGIDRKTLREKLKN
jgi:DNA-binding NtrC family response regulator